MLGAKDKAALEYADALETLCRAYWYPLYALVRGLGHSPQDAQDLTQEFFARLLAKDYLRVVDPQKGRFRTFLRMALKRFLANEWDRLRAQKRGAGQTPLAFDTTLADEIGLRRQSYVLTTFLRASPPGLIRTHAHYRVPGAIYQHQRRQSPRAILAMTAPCIVRHSRNLRPLRCFAPSPENSSPFFEPPEPFCGPCSPSSRPSRPLRECQIFFVEKGQRPWGQSLNSCFFVSADRTRQ